MAYRNIFIANQATLKLKNQQLVVNNGEEFVFPVEDIRCIVIDNALTTISARLISFLAENGVCLIISDSKHMPSAQLVPIGTYCRVNKRIILQLSQTKPVLKRIWQQIVVAKIQNQSACLKFNNKQESEKLSNIAKSVLSGDSNNREGYAANLYFKSLFGKDFTRSQDNEVNAALNYGYAIIRAFISKTLISYGFEPSIGIHHKSQLNAYCLADDLIEPFRPIVDLYVSQNYTAWDGKFSTAQKGELLRLLNSVSLVDGERYSVAYAIELLIQSIISSYENGEIILKLPTLIETSYFDYD